MILFSICQFLELEYEKRFNGGPNAQTRSDKISLFDSYEKGSILLLFGGQPKIWGVGLGILFPWHALQRLASPHHKEMQPAFEGLAGEKDVLESITEAASMLLAFEKEDSVASALPDTQTTI